MINDKKVISSKKTYYLRFVLRQATQQMPNCSQVSGYFVVRHSTIDHFLDLVRN